MKVKVYRHSALDVAQTVGVFPRYDLNGLKRDWNAFCDAVEVELPEGYSTVECDDEERRIRDPDGYICDLVTNKDHGFWICPFPTEGVSSSAVGIGLYVRVKGDPNRSVAKEAPEYAAKIAAAGR